MRPGLRRILFSIRPESEARAIDEYLKSLEPVRSPALADGEVSASAKRGRKVFEGAGCMTCHPEGLFTDLKSHDVGTQGPQGKGKGVHAEARRRGEAEGLDTPNQLPPRLTSRKTAPFSVAIWLIPSR